MRHRSVPPLLALLCALLGMTLLHAAEDPGALFLQAYQAFKGAEKLESDGRPKEAIEKYRLCASMLTQIQKATPDYEPIVIDFRLKKSRESIARVESGLASAETPSTDFGPAPPAAPEVRPPASSPAAPLLPRLSVGYRIPVAGQAVPAAPIVPPVRATPVRDDLRDTTDEIIGRGAITALRDQIRALQLRLNQERLVNEDLRNKVLEFTAREQSALTEVDRTKVLAVESKARVDQLQQALQDAQETSAQLSRAKGADDQRIAGLETDLEAARADLEVANEYSGELFTKLEAAAKFIESSEKIRSQLLVERRTLASRPGSKAANLAKVQGERDAARAKNEELAEKVAAAERQAAELGKKLASAEAQILDGTKGRADAEEAAAALRVQIAELKNDNRASLARIDENEKQAAEAEKLARQNQDLAAKLSAAEQQIAATDRNRGEREKIEAGLRSEVESVNKTLAGMRGQLATGGKRIAELEKQLADTSSAAATTTGAMAEENALLKSLVARQLGEQARRQQARRLVQEEMEKLQIRSTTLADKLDALGAAEAELSPRERKLFENPVAAIAGGADFSLVISKAEATPEPVAGDLPAELAERAKTANELARVGRLAESRSIYDDLVRKAPRSHFAAINLGITERNLGNYPQAVAAFKRALELKAGDAFTLTNLGGAQFRGGELAESIATLRKAIAADSESYLAHYLLALALHENGESDEARREVARALDLKSDYVPAVQLNGDLGKQAGPEQPAMAGPGAAR